jgi:hypothetical protein
MNRIAGASIPQRGNGIGGVMGEELLQLASRNGMSSLGQQLWPQTGFLPTST